MNCLREYREIKKLYSMDFLIYIPLNSFKKEGIVCARSGENCSKFRPLAC